MELRHLRYFVTLADERHFGRAAARLHVTQSTLSGQVKVLEREVGGPLFARTSRRVDLTEAGELLLPEARRALDQADRALTVARHSVRGEVGSVRIGFAGVAVLQGVLGRDAHRFHRAHPRVELSLAELSPAEQAEAVRDGALDIGYCPDLGLDDVEGLRVDHRTDIPLAVAVRPDHVLAASPVVTAEALAAHELVLFAASDQDATVVPRLWPVPGEGPARTRSVGSTLGVLALAAAGVGVAVVPAATESIALPDVVYRPLRGASPGPDLMIISRSDDTSGPVRAYLRGLSGS